MKYIIASLSALVVATLFLSGCTGSRHERSDSDITASVKSTLSRDPTLGSAGIDVDTDDGVVTLKGKVIGQDEATKAVLLAREVEGVVSVDSKLEIDTHITNPDITKRVKQGEKTAEELNELKKDARDKP